MCFFCAGGDAAHVRGCCCGKIPSDVRTNFIDVGSMFVPIGARLPAPRFVLELCACVLKKAALEKTKTMRLLRCFALHASALDKLALSLTFHDEPCFFLPFLLL